MVYYNGHADAKLAVLLFTHLTHACKTQCVDYSISTREASLYDSVTFAICDI